WSWSTLLIGSIESRLHSAAVIPAPAYHRAQARRLTPFEHDEGSASLLTRAAVCSTELCNLLIYLESGALRHALYVATLVAVRFRPEWQAPYQRLLDRGRAKKEALTILSRKLLKVIYHLLRTGASYDPAYIKPAPRGPGLTAGYELSLFGE